MCSACSLGVEDKCSKRRPAFAATQEHGKYLMRQHGGQSPRGGSDGHRTAGSINLFRLF